MHWIGLFVLGYVFLVALLFIAQRSLLYPAATQRPKLDPHEAPGFQEISTEPEAGIKLHHWYRPPDREQGPVIVLFQGNAGHRGHRVEKFDFLSQAGYGLMLVGYRGYGGNPGRPSEEGLSADARSVFEWLRTQGITSERIVLYGESLGTAVAISLAEKESVAGLVLEAPMSSVMEVAQSHYWYVPVRWLLLDKWDSIGRIGAVEAPILFVHGARDRVVPQRFGKRLFEAAPQPKDALFPEAGEHNNLMEIPQVRSRILAFVGTLEMDAPLESGITE